jgi:quercetin dioxygenase-like cupin family protein
MMEIKRVGSQPSGKGQSDYFTGTVRIDPLFSPPDPARVAMALVTFEPGARTAWHTHPLGQTLIVTSGCGWAQREGGPVEEIRHARDGDESYRHPGETRRFDRHVAGKGERRAVPAVRRGPARRIPVPPSGSARWLAKPLPSGLKRSAAVQDRPHA